MQKINIFLLLGFTIFLYTVFLNRTPIHLNQDELGFSLNAYSVAKTGFDENGRFLPLYFWHLNVMWATPIIVYLTALVLKVLPLSEVIIRLPSVFIGVLDVALIYFLVKLIFKSEKWAIPAGILLALTPVHFIQSRILLDNLYIVPFVLSWLILLVIFQERKKIWILFLAGLVLGFGIHSYHAAKIMIPLYLFLTFWLLFPQIKRTPKILLAVILGFSLPLIPLIPWLLQYPDTFVDQVKYTRLYDAKLSALSGVATLLTRESIAHRFDVFISYFNPYFLFFRGDASLIHSTHVTGVFLLSLALFIPLGIYKLIKERDRFKILFLIGFLTSPISTALIGDHYRISRSLTILPFAIILAVYGMQFLISQRNNFFRFTCYLLIIAIPLQFTYFIYDYFTDYRIRSYAWMKYNIPDALEGVIREDSLTPTNKIFLDNRVEFIDRYWRFYLIKNNKEKLEQKTEFVDLRNEDVRKLPENSIILFNFNDVDGLKTEIGPFHKVANIFEPDGVSTFYIFRN